MSNMEHIAKYSEEYEAITDNVVLDVPSESSNPLNEFSTDLTISEVERIKKYSCSPFIVQRYSFIKYITRLCENDDYYGVSTGIVPILDKITSDKDNTICVVALNQFGPIADLYFRHDYTQAIQFVTVVAFPILKRCLLNGINDIQKAAIEGFVACCKHIHREDQGIYTYLFILELAQSTSRIERIIACKLFRNVASILGSEIITQFGVSELLLLAKDPYCQVRKHAILAFGPVSDMLDSEIVENGIYNALIKNTKSSAWVIRRACAIVIPEVIRNIHSHKIFLNLLKPIGELFRDNNPYVKQAMLQSLGHVIAVIPDKFNINDDIKTRYLQLGNKSDDLTTSLYCRCCAFYFPAVLRALSPTHDIWKDLRDVYNRLASHEDVIVRRCLSYSLHKVAEILGVGNSDKFLVPIQEKYLQDTNDEVRMGVIKNMAKFWNYLQLDTRCVQAVGLSAILSQLKANKKWRYRYEICNQLTEFCSLLAPKNVLEELAPVYLDLLNDPVEKVRALATKATYAIINKSIQANNQRGAVLIFQIITLAKSKKYLIREMFVLCCPSLVKLLSEKSFCKLIQPVLIHLSKDPVANVRECVLHLLLDEPSKRIRRLYGFNIIIANLQLDQDREIIHLLSSNPLTEEMYSNYIQSREQKKDDELMIEIEDVSPSVHEETPPVISNEPSTTTQT